MAYVRSSWPRVPENKINREIGKGLVRIRWAKV
uniref:Uncharacterized protein n=1 Tax=Arundo donax TaxID=35708 RepID=A0A0A9BXP7_ARUDO